MRVTARGKLCTRIHKAQVSKAALRVSLFNSLFKSLSNSSFTCNDRRLITVTFWPHLFCWHRQVPRLLFSAPHFFLSLRKQILVRVGEHSAEDQSHCSEDTAGSVLPGFGGHRASNYWHVGPALRHSDHRLLG